MGALHAGHSSLIEIAREYSKKLVVSIFVNPTQFGPSEDLENYPRPIEDDISKLKKLDVDYLFLPEQELIYPDGLEVTHYADKDLANALCGLNRPGHFDGVCTVVYKLFDLVKPKYAVFGEKDFQQLKIIQDLVVRENLDIEIISAPILREEDGLAMSSRNLYLDPDERQKAAKLNQVLKAIVENRKSIDEAKKEILELGFELDYLEEKWGRVFLAAKLGQTRLIDNMAL